MARAMHCNRVVTLKPTLPDLSQHRGVPLNPTLPDLSLPARHFDGEWPPLRRFASPVPRSAARLYSTTYGTHPGRIILTEDDHALRTLISSVLREDGYEVTESKSGAWLCAMLAAHSEDFPADVVITDWRMPDLGGVHVLSMARRLPRRLPVIVITAFGSEETHRQARELGAAAVFDKPLDLDDLRTAVLHVWRNPTTSPRVEMVPVGKPSPMRRGSLPPR